MFRTIVRHFSVSNKCLEKSIKTPIPVFGVEGRYVSALYSAASQMKQLDEVDKSLKALQKELAKPNIKDFIATSLISRSEKSKLLKEIAKSANMPEAAVNFLGIVAENGRLKSLRKIITMFNAVMTAHKNEALCEIITAEPLDDESRKTLMETLKKFVKEGQKIQLHEKIDESIIGGIVVGIEDKHIDISIARKIVFYSDIIKSSL